MTDKAADIAKRLTERFAEDTKKKKPRNGRKAALAKVLEKEAKDETSPDSE